MDVEQAMRGEVPETIQKYVVEVNGTVYPPKQSSRKQRARPASRSRRWRRSVLNKIGFVCREAGKLPDGRSGWVQITSEEPELKAGDHLRIAALEAAVATAQEAVAGLSARVQALEIAH